MTKRTTNAAFACQRSHEITNLTFLDKIYQRSLTIGKHSVCKHSNDRLRLLTNAQKRSPFGLGSYE